MRYLIDTNVASYRLRNQSAELKRRMDIAVLTDEVCISVVSEAELLFGLHRIGAGERRFTQLDEFLGTMHVLPWGRDEAYSYAVLRNRQDRIGRPLAALDMMIAAHALAANATLVTHDAAFHFVSGLNVEDWAADLA